MKSILLVVAVVICCLAAVDISTSTPVQSLKPKQELNPDFFAPWFNNVEIYERVLGYVIATALTLPPYPMIDPMPFKDFTFDHLTYFRNGTSHIYDAVMFGLSNMSRVLTVNNATKECSMEIKVPNVTLVGNYDMLIKDCHPQFECPPVPSFEGSGSYNHIITNITFVFNFTVVEESERIKTNHLSSTQKFDQIALYAENYTIDGVLQTDWETISKEYKRKFDSGSNVPMTRRIFVEESISLSLNVFFGFLNGSLDNVINYLNELAQQFAES